MQHSSGLRRRSWMAALLITLAWGMESGCDRPARQVYASDLTQQRNSSPQQGDCVCGEQEALKEHAPDASTTQARAEKQSQQEQERPSTRQPVTSASRRASAPREESGWIELTPPAPAKGAASHTSEEPQTTKLIGVINVNEATSAQLELLPGVGAAMSAKIIAARQRAPLRSPSQMKRIKGMGPSTYAKIAPHLRTDGPTTLRAR